MFPIRPVLRAQPAPRFSPIFSSLLAPTARPSLTMMPQRHLKIGSSELKKGMIVERKGKLYSVVDYMQITPGRRASIMQVEFKELNTGTKINERLRSEEKVEMVQLEDTDAEYGGTNDDGKLLFKDSKNMEDIEVDPAIISPAHLVDYLREGHTYRVQRVENDVVRVVFPVKAAVEITAEKAGGSGSHGDKVVTLSNGRTIKVPEHSKVGSKVWIRLHDENYMSRVLEGEDETVAPTYVK